MPGISYTMDRPQIHAMKKKETEREKERDEGKEGPNGDGNKRPTRGKRIP